MNTPVKPDMCGCGHCSEHVRHSSNCAVHNAPALPVGPCDCGAAAKPDDRKWLPMSALPDNGRRDADGKWHDEPGPIVELKFRNGRIKQAQWRGERNVQGGETWAFWSGDDRRGIGLYHPIAWRLAGDE